ncbi:MAG TPA: heme-copper oxidase subunit III [Chitinophagaceae bacterium]|jgi:cytochrome c oxidase subunit 3|nr:heme-copper oxidase subunit III [Chitinophagaceae bacterium]
MLSDIKLKNIQNSPSGGGGKIHPHKFTLWVAMASIIMMFAGLTSAYIVKSNQANWVDVETPVYFWYSTAAILISSFTILMAVRAFKQRDMAKYRALMVTTAVLGVVFIVLQWKGFHWMWENGVRFKGAGAGQFLYVIAGLHAVHVIGGIITLLVLTFKAFFGKVRSYNAVPVEVASTYWHFVDFLWIYLLIFFIYLK